ncbi:MAG: hypothetical protein ACE5H0_13905 [Bacteroidota bacterium]
MNLLKEKTQWSNWELASLKLAMLVLGVIVGVLAEQTLDSCSSFCSVHFRPDAHVGVSDLEKV